MVALHTTELFRAQLSTVQVAFFSLGSYLYWMAAFLISAPAWLGYWGFPICGWEPIAVDQGDIRSVSTDFV